MRPCPDINSRSLPANLRLTCTLPSSLTSVLKMAFAMPLTTSICYTPLDGSSFSKPKHTILIYGATSYTARLLIDYLATHPERKQFTFALAGRNPEKLKRLVDELHQANEDGEEGKTEWIACALEDTAEGYPKVAAMVSDAEVVINLAGTSEFEFWASWETAID
jgi:hypothetical protein